MGEFWKVVGISVLKYVENRMEEGFFVCRVLRGRREGWREVFLGES